MTAELELRELRVAYRNVVAVREVSMTVAPRSFVALLGPNGAGKTSLLSAVAGLVRPAGGRVLLGGDDVTATAAHDVARRGIRLVPENRALFPDMSVTENLQVGAGRLARAAFAGRVESVFALFPRLSERADQAAGTMSGGEQQMLSIARALIAEPKVLLLDEPSMGLAPMVVKAIVEALARLRDEGLTVLVAEQNARAILPVADHAVLLTRGRVELQGTAAHVSERIESEGYLGGGAQEPAAGA